jgi:hypothetical protein
MLVDLLYNYSIGLLTFLFVFGCGKVILNSFNHQQAILPRIFYSSIIGMLFTILLYAILKAHGKTILITVVPVIGYILYSFRSQLHKPAFLLFEIKKEFLWIFSIFSLIFLYQSYFFFDFYNGTIKSLFWDNYAYASYVDSLKLWGTETRYIDMNWFIPSYRTGLMPYHYPELWFSAFVSQISGISSIRSYYILSNSIIISIYFLGIASLLKTTLKNKYLLFSISFTLLFVAGISLSCFSNSITNNALWFTNMSMMGLLGSKISFVYIFVMLSFILLQKQNEILGYTALLIIPFFSIGMLPGIWGGTLVYHIAKVCYQKLKISRIDYFVFVFILSSLLFFGLFYHFFKSDVLGDNATKHIFNGGIFKNLRGGITFRNIKITVSNVIVYAFPSIFLGLFRVIIFFLLFIIIIYSSIFRNWKLWILSIIIILCGATVSTICSGLLDASQFTTNLSVLLAVLVVIGLIEIITVEQKKRLRFILVSITIVLLFFTISKSITNRNAMKDWHDDDHSFISKVAEIVKNEKTIVCLVFLNKYEYSRQPYLWWYNRNDLDLVTQYSNSCFIYSLGNPELCFNSIDIPESERYAFNNLTPLNAWKNMKMGNDLTSFIKANSIKYFYFKKGAIIPDFVKNNAETIVTSSKTESTFYKMKY